MNNTCILLNVDENPFSIKLNNIVFLSFFSWGGGGEGGREPGSYCDCSTCSSPADVHDQLLDPSAYVLGSPDRDRPI